MVEMGMLEVCICEDLNEYVLCVMVVFDLVKIVIENYDVDKVEILLVVNYLNKEEMGCCDVFFICEIYIECEDFCEEVNNKFKCLVFDKEVCLCGVYVIKVECVEKDENGEIIIIFCFYDLEMLGKNLSDGCKVKGVIYWVLVSELIIVEVCLYDCLFNVLNLVVVEDFNVMLNLELFVVFVNVKFELFFVNV